MSSLDARAAGAAARLRPSDGTASLEAKFHSEARAEGLQRKLGAPEHSA